jgi:hypothetical protein
MANHWPPKGPPRRIRSAGCKAPVRGWFQWNLALLAGSEAPDSLCKREPRASLAADLYAVEMPFVMLPIIR